MKIGPKFKIAKRLGAPIFSKTQSVKFQNSLARPGRVLKNRRGGMSDYKKQLFEKQKMRFSYGLSEHQLSQYVARALQSGHQPITTLLKALESRLDNVVYRLGIAKTRSQARQMVVHGHVTVNGRRLNVPSAYVQVGDEVAVREGSRVIGLLANFSDNHEGASVPVWLTFDAKKMSGKKNKEPVVDTKEYLFNPELVLEYYSR